MCQKYPGRQKHTTYHVVNNSKKLSQCCTINGWQKQDIKGTRYTFIDGVFSCIGFITGLTQALDVSLIGLVPHAAQIDEGHMLRLLHRLMLSPCKTETGYKLTQ